MVQGLGFLSKKSWHTKNLANQERVFLAEQRKEEEERRTHELAKQIQQEREQEELAKIAGKSASQYDRGIDWMYNHGQDCAKEDRLKEREEYLLGKAIGGNDPGCRKGDLATAAEEQGGVNKVLSQQMKRQHDEQHDSKPPANYAEPSVAEKNEAFRIRVEDPMYAVMQRSREIERAVQSKAKLYEKVTGKTAVLVTGKGDDEKKKKEKKSKRKSKHKKHSRHYSDESSLDSSSDSSGKNIRRSSKHRRKRSRSRSRSPERDEKARRRQHSSTLKDIDRREERIHPLPRSDDYGRSERRGRHRNTTSPDDYDRKELDRRKHGPIVESCNRRKGGAIYPYDERHDCRIQGRSGSISNGHHSLPHHDDGAGRRDERYGLQGRNTVRNTDFGPDADLLLRKRREKDEMMALRPDDSNVKMTTEEKAAALQAMQQDATRRREYARKRLSPEREGRDMPSQGHASFLNELVQQAHGVNESSVD